MTTRNLSEVVDGIIGIIKEPENRVSIGLTDLYPEGSDNEFGVFFGEEMGSFTHLPIVVVEGVATDSTITQTGFKTQNDFEVSVVVCHADMQKSSSQVRRESLERAETLRNILHKDLTIGGRVIYGYVTGIRPGYVQNQGSLIFSHMLSWYGMNKMFLKEDRNEY